MLLICRLTILTNRVRLRWLVKRLKIEDICPAADHLTNSICIERLGIRRARHGVLIYIALSRPSRLANPEFNLLTSSSRLDSSKSLGDIVVKDGDRVSDCGALPVGKSINKEDVGHGDDGICSTVCVFVPRICRSVVELGSSLAKVVDSVNNLLGGLGLAI